VHPLAQASSLVPMYPFGRSVFATTYQMASVHLRFAKQNNAELKPKQGFGLVFCAWFDNLEIRHKGAIIAQETHYDPWGLELVGIGRQGLNRFTFNGQSEKQANLADGKGYFYETDFRSYDATLGRFHAYDLMASAYDAITPYHFALNNPISANDPTGLESEKITDKARREGRRRERKMRQQAKGKRVALNGVSGNKKKEKVNRGNGEQKGEIWYYMYKHEAKHTKKIEDINNTGHAMVYNPHKNIVYEINHSNQGKDEPSGFKVWVNGGPKAVHYIWDFNIPGKREEFWNYRGGRGHIRLYPVKVLTTRLYKVVHRRSTDVKAGNPWTIEIQPLKKFPEGKPAIYRPYGTIKTRYTNE